MFNKVTSKFKTWYAISLAVLLLGALSLLLFKGFNAGIDFTGGTSVTVNTGSYITLSNENRQSVSKISREIFKENGMAIESEQFSPTEGLLLFSFRHNLNGKKVAAEDFNAKAEEVSTLLLEELQQQITASTADFDVQSNGFSKTVRSHLIWRAALSVAAFLAVVFVYAAIRLSVPSGVSIIISAAHDILIMLALCALFRVQINPTIIAAVFLTAFYSAFLSALLFAQIKQMKRDKAALKNNEMADTAMRRTFARNIASAAVLLIFAVLLLIVGVTAIKKFALPIVLGIIAATYSSLFISPSMWTHFQKVSDKIKSSDKYQAKKAAKKAARKKAEESA